MYVLQLSYTPAKTYHTQALKMSLPYGTELLHMPVLTVESVGGEEFLAAEGTGAEY